MSHSVDIVYLVSLPTAPPKASPLIRPHSAFATTRQTNPQLHPMAVANPTEDYPTIANKEDQLYAFFWCAPVHTQLSSFHQKTNSKHGLATVYPKFEAAHVELDDLKVCEGVDFNHLVSDLGIPVTLKLRLKSALKELREKK